MPLRPLSNESINKCLALLSRILGVGFQGGVDVFGERLAGCAAQRPGGGAGGVVVQRDRCFFDALQRDVMSTLRQADRRHASLAHAT